MTKGDLFHILTPFTPEIEITVQDVEGLEYRVIDAQYRFDKQWWNDGARMCLIVRKDKC